jgi:hypothetical protein
MSELAIRLGVIAILGVMIWLTITTARAYVYWQKRQALSASPLVEGLPGTAIRIMAFSTETCRQCHTHQWPAIQRVQALRPDRVVSEEIDTASHPELVERYHILTVPSTVVLDGGGHVQAVNYGFINTQGLLEQIDALL